MQFTVFQIFIYLIVAVASIYIGKLDKRITVGGASAVVSVPLGALSATCVILMIPIWLFILFLIFTLLAKLKVFIVAKVAALCASFLGMLLGVVLGPIGWIGTAIIGLLVILCIREACISFYTSALHFLSRTLIKIRTLADKARSKVPLLALFVFILEITIVCGLAIKEYWHLLDWVDEKIGVHEISLVFRIPVCILLAFLLFRSYRRSTTPPADHPEVMDLGTSPIGDIIHHF